LGDRSPPAIEVVGWRGRSKVGSLPRRRREGGGRRVVVEEDVESIEGLSLAVGGDAVQLVEKERGGEGRRRVVEEDVES
jgi:hypothetical protein